MNLEIKSTLKRCPRNKKLSITKNPRSNMNLIIMKLQQTQATKEAIKVTMTVALMVDLANETRHTSYLSARISEIY